MKNTLLNLIINIKKINEAQWAAILVIPMIVGIFSTRSFQAGVAAVVVVALVVTCYYTVAKPLEVVTEKLLKKIGVESVENTIYTNGWAVRLMASLIIGSTIFFFIVLYIK